MTTTTDSLWLSLLGADVVHQELGGVTTRLVRVGSGEPLVMLHGAGGHAETFARNLVPLGSVATACAVDMLGHGLTAAPPPDFSILDLVAHVEAVVTSLGSPTVSLLGVSLGGFVAAQLAIERPDLVSRLVLTTNAGLRVDHAEGAAAPQDVTASIRRITDTVVGAPTRDDVRRRLEWLMARPERVTEELVELRFRLYSRPESRSTMARIRDLVMGPDGFGPLALTPERLSQISAPTLVVWGRQNPSTSWQEAEAAAAHLPDAELVVFDDCAHWPQFEHADAFNELVERFLLRTAHAVRGDHQPTHS